MPTRNDHQLVTSAAIQLDIQGMTCASRAARIEKQLNSIDGVDATVNYATGQAHVDRSDDISVDQLITAVGQAGYASTPPRTADDVADHDGADDSDRELAAFRRRVIITAALSLPVIITAMVPVWQFPGWQWVSLALTLVVVGWSAWPFHRAALVNLRHRNATMDTLISIGTLAATGWSIYALILARRAGSASPTRLSSASPGTARPPISILKRRWVSPPSS